MKVPKKEAKELVNQFELMLLHEQLDYCDRQKDLAKQGALLCVKNIKKALNNTAHGEAISLKALANKADYWYMVEQEINKIK